LYGRANGVTHLGFTPPGPHEYLHLLIHEALPLQPNVIVVSAFLGNDFTTSLRPGDGHRRWFDRDNLLVSQVPRRLVAIAVERRALAGRAGALLDAPGSIPAAGRHPV
jgi:hypothetical protein